MLVLPYFEFIPYCTELRRRKYSLPQYFICARHWGWHGRHTLSETPGRTLWICDLKVIHNCAYPSPSSANKSREPKWCISQTPLNLEVVIRHGSSQQDAG